MGMAHSRGQHRDSMAAKGATGAVGPMRGVPHLLIGASAGVLVAGGVHQETVPIVVVAAGSALLPDLDVPSSTASGLFRGATGVAGLVLGAGVGSATWQRTADPVLSISVGVAAWVVALVLTRTLAPWRLLEHRGPFHSILVGLLAGLMADVATGQGELAVAVMAGWLSHLVADDLTHMGQPLLWPLTGRLVHVTPRALRFRSGSWIEWPLALACLAISTQLVGRA
jgi:inner membrane protein